MGHTNSTVNYNLPQFVGTDKPSWLGDVNGAFLAIDTAIAAAKSQADSAAGGVAGLQTTVSGHTTQIGTLTDTVTAQGGTLNSVTALIGNGTPTTTDQTIIGAINELLDDIKVHTVTYTHNTESNGRPLLYIDAAATTKLNPSQYVVDYVTIVENGRYHGNVLGPRTTDIVCEVVDFVSSDGTVKALLSTDCTFTVAYHKRIV